jgi:hypothetical protein
MHLVKEAIKDLRSANTGRIASRSFREKRSKRVHTDRSSAKNTLDESL